MRKSFLDYVKEGNLDVVKKRASREANAKDKDGYTALMVACNNRNLEIVKCLVENGADVNAINENGNPYLIKSRKLGIFEKIDRYLNGTSPTVYTKDHTDLLKACKEGMLRRVEFLVEERKVNVNAKNLYGKTALRWAYRRRNMLVVEYLVEKGADVSVINDNHITPLMISSNNGSLEVVKYLVENGATINSEGISALMYASKNGYLEIVEYLVENGADVNAKDKSEWAALMVATLFEHTDIIEYLIKKGADIHAVDKNGETAVMRASGLGNLEIVKCLVEKGADVNIVNKFGYTALIWASYGGRLSVVKYLVSRGVDINVKTLHKSKTALSLASEMGHKKVVDYLESKGATR